MPEQLTFDLSIEPWIRVLRLDGSVEELGLVDVCAQASEIRCILGDVPTQVMAIQRLLLALVYASLDFGPQTAKDWSVLWETRTLPADGIRRYLEDPARRARFDLFHPETPFYQVAGLRTARDEVFGLERLIADVPTGAQFFTTRSGRGLDRIDYAEAARWVVHAQAFDVSGIKSGAVGDERVKGGKGYPIGVGNCGALGGICLDGDTLAETILLNLVPMDRFTSDLIDEDRDLPVWERDPQTSAEETPHHDSNGRPYGPLDLLTWQSRRIRLAADGMGVTGVLLTNGDRIDLVNRFDIETMTGWRRSEAAEKRLKTKPVFLPRTHDSARALWRGLEALLPKKGADDRGARAPKVLDWAAEAVKLGYLDGSYQVKTRAIGMTFGTQSSVTTEILDDVVPMPAALLVEENDELRGLVIDAVSVADAAAAAVSHLGRRLARAAGGDLPAGTAARDIGRAEAFARLDFPFRAWIAKLTAEVAPDAAMEEWHRTVRGLMRKLGEAMVARAGAPAWVGREVDGRHLDSALAEHWFLGALAQAVPTADRPESPPTDEVNT